MQVRVVALLDAEELLLDMQLDRPHYLIEALLAAHGADTALDEDLRMEICRLRLLLCHTSDLLGKPAVAHRPAMPRIQKYMKAQIL